VVLDIGACLEVQILGIPATAELSIVRTFIALAAGHGDPQATAGRDAQVIAEAFAKLNVVGQQDVLHLAIAGTGTQQQLHTTDAAAIVVLHLEQWVVLAARNVSAVDLADHHLVAAGYLLHFQDGTEIIVRACVLPVIQAAVVLGFAQLATGVARISGGRAGYRYPEGHAAIAVAPEVAAFITIVQTLGADGGGSRFGWDREIPGGQI